MFAKRRQPPVPETKALAEAASPSASPAPPPAPLPEVPRCANIVAADARIKGSIMAVQDLEVAGIVRGDIECHGRLVVAAGGEVHGQVTARDLVIDGLVQGDVEVSGRLAIGREGRLQGDASARTVSVEEGAMLSGSCAMGRRRAAPANDEPETIFLSRIMDDDDAPTFGRTAIGA